MDQLTKIYVLLHKEFLEQKKRSGKFSTRALVFPGLRVNDIANLPKGAMSSLFIGCIRSKWLEESGLTSSAFKPIDASVSILTADLPRALFSASDLVWFDGYEDSELWSDVMQNEETAGEAAV